MMRSVVLALLLIGCGSDFRIMAGEDTRHTWGYNPRELDDIEVEERFQQVIYPMADVLFVIDNSCSMSNEQEKLLRHFPVFMDHFIDVNIDYHIGVTTVDPLKEGILNSYNEQRWVNFGEPDPYGVFNELATVRTYGSGEEKGREAVYNAVNSDHNGGFMRGSASFHVILISDEPDQSDVSEMDLEVQLALHPGIGPSRRAEVLEANNDQKFVNWFNDIKPSWSLSSFSAIVGRNPSTCFEAEPGVGYYYAPVATGGFLFDICEDDWTPALRTLGLASAGYMTAFPLAHIPVEETLVVYVRDLGIAYEVFAGEDWEYMMESNSISFIDKIPPSGSEVIITYILAG